MKGNASLSIIDHKHNTLNKFPRHSASHLAYESMCEMIQFQQDSIKNKNWSTCQDKTAVDPPPKNFQCTRYGPYGANRGGGFLHINATKHVNCIPGPNGSVWKDFSKHPKKQKHMVGGFVNPLLIGNNFSLAGNKISHL